MVLRSPAWAGKAEGTVEQAGQKDGMLWCQRMGSLPLRVLLLITFVLQFFKVLKVEMNFFFQCGGRSWKEWPRTR